MIQRTRRSPLLILIGILVVAALLFWGWAMATLNFSYSEGERNGFLQKFSKVGWFCKTWEGEMLLTSMPGAIPEKFHFSVRDDAVAAQLTAAVGKRVTLSYEQHKAVPTTCFGNTEYFIEKVQVQ
ncbi:hypothetical protein OU994_09990 [Pseudoduganella sp. SL102]|uniref:hypothetical protein n=1 Tax=Pseudoduganella sp. SL102 TaxID=2995154 RepID=UPI00248AF956|nr:hypothetical protein [Pseudoduganella sp. SL102]WBS04578.1 hypothetical protein OU994_09990 [Pseudoduganella sp. SL102]